MTVSRSKHASGGPTTSESSTSTRCCCCRSSRSIILHWPCIAAVCNADLPACIKHTVTHVMGCIYRFGNRLWRANTRRINYSPGATYWMRTELVVTRLTAARTHVPYGLTQCYLPPGRGDVHAFTSAKLSWYSIWQPRTDKRLSWPSWLITYRQRRDCDLNPGPFPPMSSTLTTRLPCVRSSCFIGGAVRPIKLVFRQFSSALIN